MLNIQGLVSPFISFLKPFISLIIAVLACFTAPANAKSEFDFETVENNPQSIEVDWAITGDKSRFSIDSNMANSGSKSIRVDWVKEKNYGWLLHVFDGEFIEEGYYTLKGHIKTEDFQGRTGIFLHVQSEDKETFYYDDMRFRVITSSVDWTEIEMILPAFDKTKAAKFGLFVTGKGTVWMDDVSIAMVDQKAIPPLSDELNQYLMEAFEIMEANAINRNELDWGEIRYDAFRFARIGGDKEAVYGVIRTVLGKINKHSYLTTPLPDEADAKKKAPNPEVPSGIKSSNIGYISIPGFAGSLDHSGPFAKQIATKIAAQSGEASCGWIIDLRQNNGGNMWPMVAGLGYFWDDASLGRFVYPDNSKDWWYRQGAVGFGDLELFSLVNLDLAKESLGGKNRYQKNVAVLTGPMTSSSGEAVALSFKALPNARLFGAKTMGFSTVNKSYSLSDGANLILTIGTFADTTGKLYGGPIYPDTEVHDGDNPGNPVEVAIEWLQDKNACQKP